MAAVSPRTGMFSFWQPLGNIRADLAACIVLIPAIDIDDMTGDPLAKHCGTVTAGCGISVEFTAESGPQSIRSGSMSVALEARDITKVYGHVSALSGANLEVKAGEVTALIGDNGAGKSTLVRILS